WTKSMDATHSNANCNLDIFARDNKQVEGMLNRHLRWMEGPEDNLVPWTSSLFVEMVRRSMTSLMINTTSFPKGVFLRDMDLIGSYCSFDANLRNFEVPRSKKRRMYLGCFYFGEYLPQGALKIEDNCQLVSAQAIIDKGLYDLQPGLSEFAKWETREKPRWARNFYHEAIERQGISIEEQEAAINIAQLFDQRWRLPVAANLIALLPRRSRDSGILLTFRTASFTGSLPLPAT
ncbi:hypothetical protein F5883DRAFT_440710, partial [Diaporthe sp. PMI_573]